MSCHSCCCCCCCCLNRETALFTQTPTETGWAKVKHTTPNCHLILNLIPFCDAHTVYLLHPLRTAKRSVSPRFTSFIVSLFLCFFCLRLYCFLEAMMDGFAPLNFSVTTKCVFAWLLVRPTEGGVVHSPDLYTVSDTAQSLSLSHTHSLSLMWLKLFQTNYHVIDSFSFFHANCVCTTENTTECIIKSKL